MKSKGKRPPTWGRVAYKGCCDLCGTPSTTRWYRKFIPGKVICKSCCDKERRKDPLYKEKRNTHNKGWTRTFNGAAKCARDKGTPFELTKEEWEAKVVACFYCGGDISQNSGTRLDRVDNNLGYTNDNTVGCCRQCNVAKNNYSLDEFKNWIKAVYNKINS